MFLLISSYYPLITKQFTAITRSNKAKIKASRLKLIGTVLNLKSSSTKSLFNVAWIYADGISTFNLGLKWRVPWLNTKVSNCLIRFWVRQKWHAKNKDFWEEIDQEVITDFEEHEANQSQSENWDNMGWV